MFLLCLDGRNSSRVAGIMIKADSDLIPFPRELIF
jgi:hypothetical protein